MIVIEFLGMPKAGKTTAIEILESFLKNLGKKVRIIYEGARVSPLDKKDRFLYNSWSFHNTLNRILEAKLNNYDFILIDRGVYDHIAFVNAIENFTSMKNVESCEEYYKLFEEIEDYIFLYQLNPNKAIEREAKHNPFLGRIFSVDFLKKLYNSYEKVSKDLIENKKFKLFNGENSCDENSKNLLDFIKTII